MLPFEPPHDVGGGRERHPELGGDLGETYLSPHADEAERGVAVRVDPVGRELAVDELRHPLVGCDELQQEREPPLGWSGASALRGGGAGLDGVDGIVSELTLSAPCDINDGLGRSGVFRACGRGIGSCR